MTNMYPPYWEGRVGIDFSRDEWEAILHELYMLYSIPDFPENSRDDMIINIIDRIEKSLGTE